MRHLILLAVILMAAGAQADSAGEPGRGSGKPNSLNNVYFGEQHLHSANSPDAFAMGTRNTPDDAYRYCKGEAVKKNTTGKMVQKKTPYDWCALTDHAEYLGIMPMLLEKDNPLEDTEMGKLIATGDPKKGEAAFQLIISSAGAGKPISYMADPKLMSSVWEKQKAVANKHNDPGKFTTLIAFEWTSIPMFQNLHHNVFFRDDKGPDTIFSNFDSVKREDLWTYQEVQREMGHENFSIPHNGNVSNSLMYAPTKSDGSPITRQWAERSNRNTVATEILQTKGQSDTHPALSPNDEFADFETSYKHLLGSGGVVGKIDHSYVRQALIDGVGFQEKIGANPWKLGIVAGADSHDGFSVNEEDNYTGVHGNTDKTPEIRLRSGSTVAGEAPKDFGTPGATGVWAPENTREAIFDAIKNKETFGTSGPLIRLRFFGSWGYPASLVEDKEFVKKAYAGGVPMGGDLKKKPASAKAPTFAVWALKDPQSGNLDRVQIIKGWSARGYSWEKVHDVALADGRKVDPKTGKAPPVGNTVDIKNASYKNTIGDSQLAAVWTDPDFDPSQHAVYYVRVLEIPTPRWSTYDAKALGIDPLPDVPAIIQERAWSSPIWYTPDPKLVKKQDFYPGLQQSLP
ncbi:MAG: DUF3604 domain-containing protein [Deltaproteobacteria bacterium]|nr:DUF3604 domain-containing protein [Deltaproteobacteria bacterium]